MNINLKEKFITTAFIRNPMGQANIILVVLDTMRKDAFDHYLYDNGGSGIKNLFTQYTSLTSTSPWTIPSHASIFSGEYPFKHGIHKILKDDGISKFEFWNTPKFKQRNMAELLSQKGYTNYGISTNIFISPFTGFDLGFDVFQYIDFPITKVEQEVESTSQKVIREFDGLHKNQIIKNLLIKRRFRELSNLALYWNTKKGQEKWLGYPQEKGSREILEILKGTSLSQPFFLFLNLMEMHEPYIHSFSLWDSYRASIGYKATKYRKISKVRLSYFEEAKRVDMFIGKLISLLKEKKIYNESLIIITSDHGQSLWEYNFGGHGTFLFDELLKVPLSIKYPHQISASLVSDPVSFVDFLPLVIDVADGEESKLNTRNTVFSEVYGISHNLDRIIGNFNIRDQKKIRERLIRFETHRIAAYNKNFKFSFDFTNRHPLELTRKGVFADREKYKSEFQGLYNEVTQNFSHS